MSENTAQAWMPIETAPKDGTPILAFNPVIGVYNTGFVKQTNWEGFPCGFAGWLGKWFVHPTHWMRPPYPPDPLSTTLPTVREE